MSDFYKEHAKEFIDSTISCDMSVQYNFFLKYVNNKAKLLDIGFGSARDMLYFKSIGFEVFGIDKEDKFVEHGLSLGLDVKKMTVEELNVVGKYHCIWACASLLHCLDLNLAFNNCYKALTKDGIMYASFKYGDFKGERNGRFFVDLTLDKVKEVISNTSFTLLDVIITNDVRVGRESEKWINIVLRK